MEQLPGALPGLLGDRDLSKLLQSVDDVTVVLPWLRGFGVDEVAGPLQGSYDAYAVRALGRAIGEPLLGPIFAGIGMGLTMYPEFRENLEEGAPPAEFMADGMIDGIGFGVGELAGWFAGLAAAPEVNVLALGVKVGADVIVGAAYDAAVDGLGGREWLTAQLQAQASRSDPASPVDPQARPVAIPTPPTETLRPTSTPSPPAPVSPTSSGREEVSQPGALPVEPIVTQTPLPPDSD